MRLVKLFPNDSEVCGQDVITDGARRALSQGFYQWYISEIRLQSVKVAPLPPLNALCKLS